ncbi:MAG: hypothetical protein ACI88L_000177 [Candidatus Paceibacteria bacterium]|jgi:hypothetical protein
MTDRTFCSKIFIPSILLFLVATLATTRDLGFINHETILMIDNHMSALVFIAMAIHSNFQSGDKTGHRIFCMIGLIFASNDLVGVWGPIIASNIDPIYLKLVFVFAVYIPLFYLKKVKGITFKPESKKATSGTP